MLRGLQSAGVWNGATGLSLLTALVVTIVMTLVVRRTAIAMRWYDLPDAGLKPHARPIPYMGGMAMLVGWLAAAIIQRDRLEFGPMVWWIVVVGGVVMALTGLADDRFHLRPRTRLLLEALVAVMLGFAGIGRALVIAMAGASESVAVRSMSLSGVGLAATVVLLIGVLTFTTNATNLIDGLDGLCAGVSAIMGVGFLLLVAALRERGMLDGSESAFLLTLSAAQIAICLGFLIFNFNPASIFMGDSGSLLLGYNVAVILVMLGDATSPRWAMAGVVTFGFPILDTSLAIVRRWKNGRPLFVGDRSHLYDQLRDRGLTVRQTALVCYSVGAAFAALGLLAVSSLSTSVLAGVYVSSGALSALVLVRSGMLKVDDAAVRSAKVMPPH